MSYSFPLFHSHRDIAHALFKALLQKGDLAVDATVGKGKDAEKLALCLLSGDRGHLFALDLQQEALDAAKNFLKNKLSKELFDRISFHQGCHSRFPEEIKPLSIQMIVYNLGYLPGGDKTITTMVESTLESMKQALPLLKPGGALLITCYPGHGEGEKEEKALNNWIKNLPSEAYRVATTTFPNRPHSPSLILIQKGISEKDPRLCT